MNGKVGYTNNISKKKKPLVNSNYLSLWYSLWHQISTPVPGSIASRCTTRSALRAAAVWRCQSRTAWVRPSPDPAAGSGAWCHDGRYRASGCRRDSGTAGTYRAAWWREEMSKQCGDKSSSENLLQATYPDKIDWYRLFVFSIITGHFVYGFWNIFEH